ncbi:uncharacterized protein [Clytia hemisphaerica]|uniref:Uncharacterized protein n=1 Tax=Clytia hemisphaerica TaxID=252671 RepID=A0A7M5WUI6_9CNID
MYALKLKTALRNAVSITSKRWSSGAIPFDPTIVLGNVVHPKKFAPLKNIAVYQQEIDGEEDAMQDNLRAIRSLQMLAIELGYSKEDKAKDAKLSQSMKMLHQNVDSAATKYAEKLQTNLPLINKEKAKIRLIDDHVETPLDFNKSLIKTDLPISSNTIKLNAQYFSFDDEKQDSQTTIMKMKSFVSGEVDSIFDSKISGKVSNAVQQQTAQQREEHSIVGTLVITATCTHANASIFSPLVIDADKAVTSWNACYEDDLMVGDMVEMQGYVSETPKTDKLKVLEPASDNEETAQEKDVSITRQLKLVTGATYGSCFVGMVHMLKSTSTTSSQDMLATAESLESNFKIAAWFTDMEGGFGIDSSFSKNLQALLSQQSILSHVSLVCEGLIPTITSEKIAIGVKAFSEFDPASTMKQLATLHNETQNANQTVSSAADNAREGKKVTELRATDVKSTMAALSEVDDGKNSVLTVNTIMTAMDEYTKGAKEGKIGIPINFFLKSLTKADIAKMWLSKYFTKEEQEKKEDKQVAHVTAHPEVKTHVTATPKVAPK